MQPEKVQEFLVDMDETVLAQRPIDACYVAIRETVGKLLENLPEISNGN